MTEHTPGPWDVQRSFVLGLPDWRVQHNHYDYRGSVVVATVDSEANARFIAASPDMEKALEKIVLEFEGYASDGLDLAIAAIAKARGETP